jgi:hypothetical protein
MNMRPSSLPAATAQSSGPTKDTSLMVCMLRWPLYCVTNPCASRARHCNSQFQVVSSGSRCRRHAYRGGEAKYLRTLSALTPLLAQDGISHPTPCHQRYLRSRLKIHLLRFFIQLTISS